MVTNGHIVLEWTETKATLGKGSMLVAQFDAELAERYFDGHVLTERTKAGFAFTCSMYSDKATEQAELTCNGFAVSVEAAKHLVTHWMRSEAFKVMLGEALAEQKAAKSLKPLGKFKPVKIGRI